MMLNYNRLKVLLVEDEKDPSFGNASLDITGAITDVVRELKMFRHKDHTCAEGDVFKIKQVPLSKIVGTSHPSYQNCWSSDEEGKFLMSEFPGKREPLTEGEKTGWQKRVEIYEHDNYIKLSKHPSLDKYYVDGDGNNRVMKSMLSKEAEPYVFAQVSELKWKPEVAELFNLLANKDFFEVSIKITDSIVSSLYLGIRTSPDSRLFYIQNALNSSNKESTLGLHKAYNSKETEVKRKFSEVKEINLWTKWQLFFLSLQVDA